MEEKVTLKVLKNREKEARRELIITAAERVFASTRVDKATMREIAEDAGMTASSIYRFFPNQEAILIAAIVRTQGRFNDLLESVIDEKKPVETLKKGIDIYIDFINENDTYFRMMTILMSHGNIGDESSEDLIRVMDRSLVVMDRIVGLFKQVENPRPLSRYIYSILVGISVSYNKLPGINQESRIRHMKSLSGMLFDMVMNYINNPFPIESKPGKDKS